MSKNIFSKRIKCVMFDLFETLARFWPPRDQIQKQACRPFGIEPTSEGIIRGYREADAFMSFENAKGPPIRFRDLDGTRKFFAQYEKLVLKGDGLNVDLETTARIWENVRNIPYGLTLFDDSLPAIMELHSLGFILGLISNYNMTGEALLRELGLEDFLEFAITSRDIGVEKPHAPIFEAALNKAGVKSEEAIYVGDQYFSDIVGARNVNISALLIDRYMNPQSIEGVDIITTLFEVKKFVYYEF